MQFFDQQTLTLTSFGLCRTKSQIVSDANASRGQWVVSASNTLAKPIPWSLKKLESYRLLVSNDAAQEIGEVICSIYWYDKDNTLRTTNTIDNVIQADDPEPIRLLPRGQLNNLYVP